MNIFEIERSKRDADFIKQNGELELEVAADIIETYKDVPYVGSLLKFGKVFINVKDWCFTKKLAKFLIVSEDIDDKIKNQFYSSLSQENYKHISAYLIHLLSTEENKAMIMGSIYKARLMNRINNNEMNLVGTYSELAVRRAMRNSKVLSSDVSAAFDPNYPSVMEKRNSAYFGKGLVFNKYTGARGKSGSNDANAEYVAKLRNIMDKNNVSFQTAELGKVDQGGGGTIAYILANYDMNVIDSGVAVLNMHAPWEIISKVDLYEALQGYVAFLKEA